MIPEGAKRKLEAHEWKRAGADHYVEPHWVSRRLFEVERFYDGIWDPACGFGRIPTSAYEAGYRFIWKTDIAQRGEYFLDKTADFLSFERTPTTPENIICNPPFDLFKPFALHALELARRKVAMIWTVRTLPAARWLKETPLRKILLLTPRPSMPPGHVIASGGKASGGTADYCWLIWDQTYEGEAELSWLHRDGP
jgi:hypothetical protein